MTVRRRRFIPVEDYECPACHKIYMRFAPDGHRHPQDGRGLLCFECADKRDGTPSAVGASK